MSSTMLEDLLERAEEQTRAGDRGPQECRRLCAVSNSCLLLGALEEVFEHGARHDRCKTEASCSCHATSARDMIDNYCA